MQSKTSLIDRAKSASKSTKITSKAKSQKDGVFVNYQIYKNLSLNYFYNQIESGFTMWNVKNPKEIRAKDRVANTIYEQVRDQQNVNLLYQEKASDLKAVFNYTWDRLHYDKTTTEGVTIKQKLNQSYSFDMQKGFTIDDKSHLIAGLNLHSEVYDGKDTGKAKENYIRDSYVLFMSYERDLDEKLSAIMGMREHIVRANQYEKKKQKFLPQLQFHYQANPATAYYVNIGKGFEMPQLSSVKKDNATEQLKPQEGWTYETGIKHITPTEGWKLALFYMDIKNNFAWVKENEMRPGGDENLSIQINKHFKNRGIEWEYDKRLDDKWHFKYAVSYSQPKSQNNKLAWEKDKAGFQTGFDIFYTEGKLSSNLNAFFLGNREWAYYTNDYEKASKVGADHHIPNSLQMNLTLRYRPSTDNLITFGVYNLLDRENPVNKYEYPALSRNIRLGYTHNF